MSLFSLIAVFLLEQLQPLNYRRFVADPLAAWADFVEGQVNAGAGGMSICDGVAHMNGAAVLAAPSGC